MVTDDVDLQIEKAEFTVDSRVAAREIQLGPALELKVHGVACLVEERDGRFRGA